MAKQRTSQKIAYYIAIFSYVAAVACAGAVVYAANALGKEAPAVAAFAASVVFFIGCGIVLHVIGKADLPDLRISK